jgi:hypothetical protein
MSPRDNVILVAAPENATVAPRRSSFSTRPRAAAPPERAATEWCAGWMPPGPTAFGTSHRGSLGTSGASDCANPAQHERTPPPLGAY